MIYSDPLGWLQVGDQHLSCCRRVLLLQKAILMPISLKLGVAVGSFLTSVSGLLTANIRSCTASMFIVFNLFLPPLQADTLHSSMSLAVYPNFMKSYCLRSSSLGTNC